MAELDSALDGLTVETPPASVSSRAVDRSLTNAHARLPAVRASRLLYIHSFLCVHGCVVRVHTPQVSANLEGLHPEAKGLVLSPDAPDGEGGQIYKIFHWVPPSQESNSPPLLSRGLRKGRDWELRRSKEELHEFGRVDNSTPPLLIAGKDFVNNVDETPPTSLVTDDKETPPTSFVKRASRQHVRR